MFGGWPWFDCSWLVGKTGFEFCGLPRRRERFRRVGKYQLPDWAAHSRDAALPPKQWGAFSPCSGCFALVFMCCLDWNPSGGSWNPATCCQVATRESYWHLWRVKRFSSQRYASSKWGRKRCNGIFTICFVFWRMLSLVPFRVWCKSNLTEGWTKLGARIATAWVVADWPNQPDMMGGRGGGQVAEAVWVAKQMFMHSRCN